MTLIAAGQWQLMNVNRGLQARLDCLFDAFIKEGWDDLYVTTLASPLIAHLLAPNSNCIDFLPDTEKQ